MEKKYVIFKAYDDITQKDLDILMRDFATEWDYNRFLFTDLSNSNLTKENIIKAAEKQGVADWVVFDLPDGVLPKEELTIPKSSSRKECGVKSTESLREFIEAFIMNRIVYPIMTWGKVPRD